MRHKAVVDLGGGGIRYEGGTLQAHSLGEAMPHMPLHLWCFGIKNQFFFFFPHKLVTLYNKRELHQT